MTFEEFSKKYLEKFRELKYIFEPEKGFIVWRVGTGENIELLHLRTFYQGKGYARELIGKMIRQLEKNPPYHTIFGFALASRSNLKEIYIKLGFNVTEEIPVPYKEPSFIFWQEYVKLKEKYL